MKVVIVTRARRDLVEIGDIIAMDDRVRAETFTVELASLAYGLAEYPERFPLIPELAHRNVRRRSHGDYLIIYRVDSTKVEVLRFLHGARDYVPLVRLGL